MKINKSRLKQIIKEELARPSGDNDAESIDPRIMRAVRDEDRRAFERSITPEDLQSVAAAMSGYRVIDNKNRGAIRTAASMADPKAILLVGTTPEHIYFKTMDDIYYRMPKSGAGLEEELGDDLGVGEIPHEFVLDELVTAASKYITMAARNMLRAARVQSREWPDIELMIEEPLMDALTDLAKTIHSLQNEE
tara:strand:- start:299 stop:877 length:579 start_codon:yes stop_codon:yes gene_type:complete